MNQQPNILKNSIKLPFKFLKFIVRIRICENMKFSLTPTMSKEETTKINTLRILRFCCIMIVESSPNNLSTTDTLTTSLKKNVEN
jgi:hypothetical protein